MDLETLQAQIQKVQEEISQKEAKVVKLKGLLTRSMRSDKRREQQIETLQIDLADRDRHILSLNNELEENRAFSASQAQRITQLEEELTELTNRLQSGVGSEAAQKRNERMKQMLERSNILYAELQTKYQRLNSELESEKHKQKKIPKPERVIITNNAEAITLNDDNTYDIGTPYSSYPKGIQVTDLRKRQTTGEKNQADAASNPNILKVYLKQVLLEFFIGDSSTQNRLIPVALQLLDCSSDQIIAAQRSYAEGRQIISKI